MESWGKIRVKVRDSQYVGLGMESWGISGLKLGLAKKSM